MTEESSLKSLALPLGFVLVGGACGFFFFQPREPTPENRAATESPLEGVSGIALGKDNQLFLGGDFGVKVMSPQGDEVRHWSTSEPANALVIDSTRNVYVAYTKRIEKFDPQGNSLLRWGKGGCEGDDFGHVTGVAVAGKNVFVADAGARVVYRFNDKGVFLNEIEGKVQDADHVGFLVPSPYFDCSVKGETLYVSNPGRFRVEKYDFEGNLIEYWGKGGVEKDEFPGCCNPTNLAVFPDGRVVTSQKGDPCLKLFSAEGEMLRRFADNAFAEGTRGVDLAIDEAGRVHAVDPESGCVRVFETASMHPSE
jgi:DNA-binding beta-propeller fold protein YncE